MYGQKEPSAKEKYKDFAILHLDSLKKNGALIVILKSKSRAVEAYEKAGNTKIAEEMMNNIKKQNRYLYKSYIAFWKFCPVFFIYAKDLDDFNKGKRTNIFVDSTYNINNDITMNLPFYIFNEFGTYYEVQNKDHDYAPGKWKNTNYENYDPSTGIPVKSDCIVVKDKLMRQYRFPFPNYVQSWGSLPGMKKAVDNLNNRFKTAFEKGFDINAAF
jgi:hypothetical protein